MSKASRHLLIVLALFLVSGLGCARKPDDSRIASEIQSKFSQDSGLFTKQLTVQASNGVVTLAGFVENDAQREAASRQASSVEGVKEVVNNLQVGIASSDASTTRHDRAAEVNPIPLARKASRTSDTKPRRLPNNQSTRVVDDSSGKLTPVSNPEPSPAPAEEERPDEAPPANLPPPPQKVTIEQGTPMTVRLVDSIDSEKNRIGDTFHATLNAPLAAEGSEAIPAGTDVSGHIVDLRSSAKFEGRSLLSLQLDTITSNGKTYNIETDQYRKEGTSRGKNTAEKVGGGAIIGGIIGAIAGGKGAAIGSAAGAGVGGGVQAASKAQQIKLPSETVLNFTLQAPVTVIRPADPNAGRPRLDNSQ